MFVVSSCLSLCMYSPPVWYQMSYRLTNVCVSSLCWYSVVCLAFAALAVDVINFVLPSYGGQIVMNNVNHVSYCAVVYFWQ